MPDALSNVLSQVGLQSARCTRLEAGGEWSLRFVPKPALKFVAVIRGTCWMLMPGHEPQRIEAGDTFLLGNAPAYVLASDLNLLPEDGMALFDWARCDVAQYGGNDTVLLAGSFVLDALHSQLLPNALPPFMLIPASNPNAAVLRSTLTTLESEIQRTEMGSDLVVRRFADVLLVQALRAYVAIYGKDSAGWIGALSDPQIGGALNLMHNDVTHRWTVDDLSQAVGMSRSAFALAFKTRVGLPPLDYLVRWRLQIACDALRRGERIADIATQIGYGSQSAFANAFKRVYGTAPTRYKPVSNHGASEHI